VKSFSEIGGYFGLDLPDHGDAFTDAIGFQSGRAALRGVLEGAGIERAFVPAYVCDAAIQAVLDAGATVETYRLDDSLYPRDLPSQFPGKSALIYVNYFGLCDGNITRLIQDFPRNQLIVDNAHALLTPHADVLATIYSPRKFVGVPDGGLLVTSNRGITIPEREDTGSLGRMKHLLRRMAYTAHDGYSDYLESENSLSDTTPLSMSCLTRRILVSIDMTVVERRRRDNFIALAARLDKCNIHKWQVDAKSTPLCYPLVLGFDVHNMKKQLAERGIYIPTYWPDCKLRVTGGIEYQLINCCLPVPCDQRYSPDQMADLAGVILSGLDNREAL